MASVDLTIQIRDGKGETGSFTINLPSTTAVADALLFATEIEPLIAPLVNGVIESIKVAIPASISAPGTPGLTSDIEEKAHFVFRTVSNFVKRFKIPALAETKVLSGSANLDTSDTDVAAFVTAMESGLDLTGVGGSGTVQPSDYRDDDILDLESAVETFGR